MKKLLLLTAVLSLVIGVSTNATLEEFSTAKAGKTDTWPPNASPQTLWGGADVSLDNDDREDLEFDDGDLFQYTMGTPYKDHPYIFLNFDEPANYDILKLRWEEWVGSGYPVKVYYWNQNSENWVPLDLNGGGIFPPGERVCTIDSDDWDNFFSENGARLIVFSYVGSSPSKWMKADVFVLEYFNWSKDLRGGGKGATGIESTSLGELKAVFK